MGVSGGPNMIEDGLVLALDASDFNSFNYSENLLPYSQDFNTWLTFARGTTVTSSVITPAGDRTAWTITGTSSLGPEYIYNVINPSFPSGARFSLSIYTPTSQTASLPWGLGGLSNNKAQINSYQYFDAGNGWGRVVQYGTLISASGTITPQIAVNSGSSFTVWGAQLEMKSNPTQYVKTSGSIIQSTLNWRDLSSNRNIFTLFSSSVSSSIPIFNVLPNKGILDFDGTGSYVSLYTTNIASAPITVCLMYKNLAPTLTTTSGIFFLDANNGGGGGRQQRIFQNSIQLYGNTNVINTIQNQAMIDALNTTNWVYLCYTASGSIANVYVNGVNVVSDYALNAPLNSTTGFNMQFGKLDSGATSFYLSGSMASSRIYNRVLSAQEILQNYNALKSRFNL